MGLINEGLTVFIEQTVNGRLLTQRVARSVMEKMTKDKGYVPSKLLAIKALRDSFVVAIPEEATSSICGLRAAKEGIEAVDFEFTYKNSGDSTRLVGDVVRQKCDNGNAYYFVVTHYDSDTGNYSLTGIKDTATAGLGFLRKRDEFTVMI